MELIILALIGLALLTFGVIWGWNMSVRKFGRNAEAMAKDFERLDEVAQRDPARLGIDIGKRYAADRMRETIREIDAETD